MADFGLGVLFGVFLGSLVYCLGLRSLSGETFWGRSYCGGCKHRLAWYDLFPVLSYLSLKGKCRYCGAKLSVNYFLIEVLVGLLIGVWFFKSKVTILFTLGVQQMPFFAADLIFGVFIISVLVIIFITDLKKGLIPDRITYPAIKITAVYLLVMSASKIAPSYFRDQALSVLEPVIYAFAASALIGLFFLSLILLTRGRGMGGGDLKLGIFLGLAFGFPNALLVLILAFLLGSAVGILLILSGRKKFGQTVPFGPFLATAGIITLFWGKTILDWYLHLRVY